MNRETLKRALARTHFIIMYALIMLMKLRPTKCASNLVVILKVHGIVALLQNDTQKWKNKSCFDICQNISECQSL